MDRASVDAPREEAAHGAAAEADESLRSPAAPAEEASSGQAAEPAPEGSVERAPESGDEAAAPETSHPDQADAPSEDAGETEAMQEEAVTVELHLPSSEEPVSAEQLLIGSEGEAVDAEASLRAVLEAVVYITDEPLSLAQISAALEQPREKVQQLLDDLVAEYAKPGRGLTVREVAGGYKLTTKPEHHEAIRSFVKNLKPPLKLSLAALETLAVIAYKQPITAPEIMEIRGVQGAGVLKTLLDRKLITTAGRKAVVGKPILYKTTREFLIQFGLKDLSELPTLKEFEELGRLALSEPEPEPGELQPAIPFEDAASFSEQAEEPTAGGAVEPESSAEGAVESGQPDAAKETP